MILDFLYPLFPHVVCITEHHLNQYEIVQFHIGNYTLGANYCRHSLKKCVVCIFFHNILSIVGTDLKKISVDQDIEACAIRLLYSSCNMHILVIYTAPTGNFTCFIKKLAAMLCSLYTLNTQLIICGDINVNYLVHNNRRKILEALLSLFNLSSTVYIATVLQNKSAKTIDNIFIDTSKFRNYVVSPLHTGLSDHDAQLITLTFWHRSFTLYFSTLCM